MVIVGIDTHDVKLIDIHSLHPVSIVRILLENAIKQGQVTHWRVVDESS